MDELRMTQAPVMRTGMLIRKPPAEVFEAFVNPHITTQFWFTRSSGRLEAGKQVEWEWQMYGMAARVTVKAVEPNERILIEWPAYQGMTTVEWIFEPHGEGATFVRITESGYAGDGDQLVMQVTGAAGGFALVLAGLKAVLEHGVRLNLITDRFPLGLEEH